MSNQTPPDPAPKPDPDCRTCMNYRTPGHCYSVLRCVNASRYCAAQPVHLWERTPTGPAPF
jgi:hypothetical protein